MASPTNCRYTPTHEWCRVEGDLAVVGITQHAVEQLTDLVYVDLPAVDAEVTAGKPFGEVESVKAVSDLNAPVSGTVAERNEAVAADPSGVTADPYGTGWLIKIRMTSPGEVESLMDAAAYDASAAS